MKIKILLTVIIIAIILIIIVIIAIPKEMTKDKMLEVAQELDFGQLNEEIDDNIVRVKEKYEGNIYKYSSYIEEIYADYVEIGGFKVYLTKDELKMLNKGEKITIVGKVNKIDIDENYNTRTIGTISDCKFVGEMKNAYFVDKTFTITGNFRVTDSSLKRYGYKDYSIDTTITEYVHTNESISKARYYFEKGNFNEDEIVEGDKIQIIGTPTLFTVEGYTSIELKNIQFIKEINE